jgi:hypothetical protein
MAVALTSVLHLRKRAGASDRSKNLNSHNFHNRQHIHSGLGLPFRLNTSHDINMSVPRFYNRIGKACALAAILLLPVLASADPGNVDSNGLHKGWQKHPPAVPEVNTIWVLIPVVGAVAFFSARRLRRSHTH